MKNSLIFASSPFNSKFRQPLLWYFSFNFPYKAPTISSLDTPFIDKWNFSLVYIITRSYLWHFAKKWEEERQIIEYKD